MANNDSRRRVKFYVLNDMRQWDDKGTGYVSWVVSDRQRCVSIIVKSEVDGSILLDSKILVSIVYQKQQDTLIVWSDMDRRDMALSFQERIGCDEIWEKICEVHGRDTSTRITSSRVNSDGSIVGGDNQDESDEDQLDGDNPNTSPSSDLPVCELNKLKDIRDFFVIELMRKSNPYKEKLTSILETENYIKRLIDLFHICEDLENIEGLNYLFEIFRSLFYLNKSPLLDILLGDDLIMEVIGCLEYDPAKSEPIKHREYIATKARFKEVIPFDNVDLVNKIHQTYKVQYIQDVILPAPSVFEENSLAALNSFIFLNKVEIANLIQEDERFLNELFENLKNTDLEVSKRRDMFLFLREYISFLHGLQQAREPLYQSLYNHGILYVVEVALSIKDEKVNTTAIEIFSQFVEVVPTLVREFILKEVESKSSISNIKVNSKNQHIPSLSTSNLVEPTSSTTPCASTSSTSSVIVTNTESSQESKFNISTILKIEDTFDPVLINFVIRQMIFDPDQELSGALQIINLLKLLIDPENMLSGKYVASKVEKSEFLAYFYKKSMCVLVAPLMANTSAGKIYREDYRIAQLENLILDFLSFCVERHTYHIKNYIMHKDLLKRILVLLKSKHQFLALSALRFLRKTLSLKEEAYNKYIIKSNLFAPLVEALKTNGSRYNILNSAIIELFDFIRSDDIKSLMTYAVENFNTDFEQFNYVRTFKDLKLRYDQHKEKANDQSNRSRLSSEGTPALYRTRTSSDRYRSQSDRIDFDREDEAWIQEDENEIEARIDAATSVNASNYILASSFSSSSSSSSSNSSNSTHANTAENFVDNIENTNIESYLEFKKCSPVNADDIDDTIFSPLKNSNPSSPTTISTTKTINIKISSATVLALNKTKPTECDLINSTDSDRSHSPLSTSPVAKKHTLVDYEYDSDEENDDENLNKTSENQEPLAKRAATNQNSHLSNSNITDVIENIIEKQNGHSTNNIESNNENLLNTNKSYVSTDSQIKIQNNTNEIMALESFSSVLKSSEDTTDNLIKSEEIKENEQKLDSIINQESHIPTETSDKELNELIKNNTTEEVMGEIEDNSSLHSKIIKLNHNHHNHNNNNNHNQELKNNSTYHRHHVNNQDHLNMNNNKSNEEETNNSIFLNISATLNTITKNNNSLSIQSNLNEQNETEQLSPTSSLSPVNLSAIEPANKRARLSNS